MPSDALPSETTLPGPVARAVAAACAEFALSGQDIANFSVDILPQGDECEVVFVPDAGGSSLPRGGRTPAGRETHYGVQLSTGQLTTRHYAR